VRKGNRFDIETFSGIFEFIVKSIFISKIRNDLVNFIKNNQIELIICSMTHVWTPFMVDSFRSLDVRYIPVIHDARPHPGENTIFNRWLSRKSLQGCDGYITLSASVKEQLIENLVGAINPVWMMPHGPLTTGVVNEPRYYDNNGNSQILFLGRIHAYKGLDIFIEAMRLLSQKDIKFTARVLGEGDISPFKKELESSEYIKVENRWLSDKDFADALRWADILILPYREASQSGIVAAAMASALPVIVTPVGGLSEQVQHGVNGLIASDVTADAIVESIMKLLGDSELFHKVSIGALESVNNELSWHKSVLTIKSVYQYFSEK
jgi:glycosyltransferase involved in cell wall biosynthesis